MNTPPARFDAREASRWFFRHGHTGWLGLKFTDQGDNWVELELPWREDLLGDAVAFQGVSKFVMRIKCAMLAWVALEADLKKIS